MVVHPGAIYKPEHYFSRVLTLTFLILVLPPESDLLLLPPIFPLFRPMDAMRSRQITRATDEK